MNIRISRRQKEFLFATEDEVLFGGSAGGGKSYGQVLDAFLYAMKYPKSKQIILRRTFPELEKSIIRTVMDVYPQEVFKYNSQKHSGTFKNGAILDFGYINGENDVYQYQSAEYDMIRFDELTHFTESMYIYLISRLRGANPYPKQVKSSSNPGNVGHAWVKARFIDQAPPDTTIITPAGTRRFIPSSVHDNIFLMKDDPGYLTRMENLPEDQKRALLYGDWDVFEGQYFTEFRRELHVIDPFPIPAHWRRYRALDYGLDMLACLWAAFDELGNAYIYKEYCKPDLLVSKAAEAIKERTTEEIRCTYAPADLWGRSRDTGKTQAEIFASNGVHLVQVQNGRIDGWLNLKEWLRPVPDGTGKEKPQLQIFSTCTELIRCIPLLQHDDKNPSDCDTQPHENTHAPDALRYLMDGRPSKTRLPKEHKPKAYDPLSDERPRRRGYMSK